MMSPKSGGIQQFGGYSYAVISPPPATSTETKNRQDESSSVTDQMNGLVVSTASPGRQHDALRDGAAAAADSLPFPALCTSDDMAERDSTSSDWVSGSAMIPLDDDEMSDDEKQEGDARSPEDLNDEFEPHGPLGQPGESMKLSPMSSDSLITTPTRRQSHKNSAARSGETPRSTARSRTTTGTEDGMKQEDSAKRPPPMREPPRFPEVLHSDILIKEMRWMQGCFLNEQRARLRLCRATSAAAVKFLVNRDSRLSKQREEEEKRLRATARLMSLAIRQFWKVIESVVSQRHQVKLKAELRGEKEQKQIALVAEAAEFAKRISSGLKAWDRGMDPFMIRTSATPIFTRQRDREDVSTPTEHSRSDVSDEDADENLAQWKAQEDEDQMLDDEVTDSRSSSDLRSDEELELLKAEADMDLEALAKSFHVDEALEASGNDEASTSSAQRTACSLGDSVRSKTVLERGCSDQDAEQDEDASSNQPIPRHTRHREEGPQSLASRPQPKRRCVVPIGHQSDTTVSHGREKRSELDDVRKTTATHTQSRRSQKEYSDNHTDTAVSKSCEVASTPPTTTGPVVELCPGKCPVPFLLRATLRAYQHEGLTWLLTLHDNNASGILADEMGLGKTIQTIALLAYLACYRGIWGPHLIIVPSSVLLNWEMEFHRFLPGFKVLTYYAKGLVKQLQTFGFKDGAFRYYMVLDEAQNIKNYQSQKWQTLLNFNSQRRLLLTGTPIQNDLTELWALVHFLMPDLFESHADWKEMFSDPLTRAIETASVETEQNLITRLHEILRPFLLRRLKREVEAQMPSKYEHVVRCSLTRRQRFLYDEFIDSKSVKASMESADYFGLLNILMQLRKVCNHPDLLFPREPVTPFGDEALIRPVLEIPRWMDLSLHTPWSKTPEEHLSRLRWDHWLVSLATSELHSLAEIARAGSQGDVWPGEVLYARELSRTPLSRGTEVSSEPTLDPLWGQTPLIQDKCVNCNMLQTLLESPLPSKKDSLMVEDARHATSDTPQDNVVWSTVVGQLPPDVKTSHPSRSETNTVTSLEIAHVSTQTPEAPLLRDDDAEFSGCKKPLVATSDFGTARYFSEPYLSALGSLSCYSEAVSHAVSVPENILCPKRSTCFHRVSWRSPFDATTIDDFKPLPGLPCFPVTFPAASTPLLDLLCIQLTPRCPNSRWLRRCRDVLRPPQAPFPDDDETSDAPLFRRILLQTAQTMRTDPRQDVSPEGALAAQYVHIAATAMGTLRRSTNLEYMLNHAVADDDPYMRLEARKPRTHLSNGGNAALRHAASGPRACLWGESFRKWLRREVLGELPAYRKVAPSSWPPSWLSPAETSPLTHLFPCDPRAILERMEPVLDHLICVRSLPVSPLGPRLFYRGAGALESVTTTPGSLLDTYDALRDATYPFYRVDLAQRCLIPPKSILQDDCGKLQLLARLLHRLRTDGHKCILFTQMSRMLDVLEGFLNLHSFTYVRLDGGTKIDVRQRVVERFNEDSKIFIFMASTRAGGVGLNLTGADTVIFYDTDWNPAMDRQAMDRCHRIGQTREVHVYRLITEATIEENILRKQLLKRMLDDIVVDQGQFTTQKISNFLDSADVKEMLTTRIDARDLYVTRVLHESSAVSYNVPERPESTSFEQAIRKIEDADDRMSPELNESITELENDFVETRELPKESPATLSVAHVPPVIDESSTKAFQPEVPRPFWVKSTTLGPTRIAVPIDETNTIYVARVVQHAIGVLEEDLPETVLAEVARLQQRLESFRAMSQASQHTCSSAVSFETSKSPTVSRRRKVPLTSPSDTS